MSNIKSYSDSVNNSIATNNWKDLVSSVRELLNKAPMNPELYDTAILAGVHLATGPEHFDESSNVFRITSFGAEAGSEREAKFIRILTTAADDVIYVDDRVKVFMCAALCTDHLINFKETAIAGFFCNFDRIEDHATRQELAFIAFNLSGKLDKGGKIHKWGEAFGKESGWFDAPCEPDAPQPPKPVAPEP